MGAIKHQFSILPLAKSLALRAPSTTIPSSAVEADDGGGDGGHVGRGHLQREQVDQQHHVKPAPHNHPQIMTQECNPAFRNVRGGSPGQLLHALGGDDHAGHAEAAAQTQRREAVAQSSDVFRPAVRVTSK